jgi:hypothetical protein
MGWLLLLVMAATAVAVIYFRNKPTSINPAAIDDPSYSAAIERPAPPVKNDLYQRDEETAVEREQPTETETAEVETAVTETPTAETATAASVAATPILTREGELFKLDGVPIQRFGIRIANALEDDATAQSLIDHLDLMKAHGIQSVNISLQGGRTGTANAFTANGSLKAAYAARAADILDALAAREMVGVITLFYQARDQELNGDEAARTAVTQTAQFLLPWRNVWLYVINEWYHPGFNLQILRTAAGQAEIYDIIKSIDPQRVTFVSDAAGANDGFYANTGLTAANGQVVVEYVRQDEYETPGQFTAAQRNAAQQDAQTSFDNGGYWFWHAAWHQKTGAANWPRFDKGGAGTAADPGASFIWNKMRELALPDETYLAYLPYLTAN